MKLRSVLFLLVLSIFSHKAAGTQTAGDGLPNIVFFLADDIGWADPGRYHEHYSGNKAKVPSSKTINVS